MNEIILFKVIFDSIFLKERILLIKQIFHQKVINDSQWKLIINNNNSNLRMIGDFIYGNENKEDAIMYLIGQEIKVSENRERERERRKTDRNEKKWLELVGV